MPTMHETIIRPVVTEKSSAAYQESLERDEREYTLEVHPNSTKPGIRQAVEHLFGVKVVGVWTANQRGKSRKVGKFAGRRAHSKRAIVRLAKGDTIDIFEG